MPEVVPLDLSSLEKALAQLEDAVALYQSDAVQHDKRLKLHLRAGAIQAFEYTYELAFRMLKRFLEHTEANPAAVDTMTFNEIIRCGFERGLLESSVEAWQAFRRNRGTTSHTYDEHKAGEVFQGIAAFLPEVRFLLAAIATHQKGNR